MYFGSANNLMLCKDETNDILLGLSMLNDLTWWGFFLKALLGLADFCKTAE